VVVQRKTLDPGLRRDDDLEDINFSHVIPAKGVAGVSDCMQSARETAMAYSPWRALQGRIQRLSLNNH